MGAAEKKKGKHVQTFHPGQRTDTTARLEQTIQKIVAGWIDITQDERDWFRLACTFANEFGEVGRCYFHKISQVYPGYSSLKADKKHDYALTGKYQQIGIGTFFIVVNTIWQ